MSKPVRVYIGLGSNLGNRLGHLTRATAEIGRLIGPVTSRSSVYVSPPWGFDAKDDFYNTVICVETRQTAEEVLKNLNSIEQQMGRVRSTTGQYESRTIDLDVIDYNGEIRTDIAPLVPHPLMHLRAFVLAPLSELDAEWVHPVLNRSAKDLLLSLESHDDIRVLNEATD